jgi:hypothetical protein
LAEALPAAGVFSFFGRLFFTGVVAVVVEGEVETTFFFGVGFAFLTPAPVLAVVGVAFAFAGALAVGFGGVGFLASGKTFASPSFVALTSRSPISRTGFLAGSMEAMKEPGAGGVLGRPLGLGLGLVVDGAVGGGKKDNELAWYSTLRGSKGQLEDVGTKGNSLLVW